MGLPSSEDPMIVAWDILTQYQHVTVNNGAFGSTHNYDNYQLKVVNTTRMHCRKVSKVKWTIFISRELKLTVITSTTECSVSHGTTDSNGYSCHTWHTRNNKIFGNLRPPMTTIQLWCLSQSTGQPWKKPVTPSQQNQLGRNNKLTKPPITGLPTRCGTGPNLSQYCVVSTSPEKSWICSFH